jgi:acyl-CoA synthetase (NDP forming)
MMSGDMTSVAREEAGARRSALDALFRPRSVAVIGASSDPGKIGGRPVAYLLRAGFSGQIHPVNPTQPMVQGLPAHASIEEIPAPVDQVVVAVPAKHLAEAVESCIRKQVGAIIIFTSGLGEVDDAGRAQQAALAARCREAGIPLLGPNCLGLFNVADGVFSTFSASLQGTWPRAGGIAIASQSGAFGTYCYTLLHQRGAGISHFVATGNEADVDIAACIAWFAEDPATQVIAVSLEGCRDGARLRAALALAAARGKPVVAMKLGASELGIEAAASHTGALAGGDAAYEATFEEAGVWRARSIEELVDVALACAVGRFPAGPRLGVVTLSGGVGVLLADAAAAWGLEMPALPEAAQARIRELVPFANPRNPVDATAQVVNDRTLLGRIMEIMAAEGGFDATIAFLALMGLSERAMESLRPTLAALREAYPDRLFILCFVCPEALRLELERMGFVVIEDPGRAVAVVTALTAFGRARVRAAAPQRRSRSEAARLPDGPIDEAAAKRLLATAGIPFVTERVAGSEAEAIAAAAAIGFPVALKVLSAELTHKSNVGGVHLSLRSAEEVGSAWREMMRQVAEKAPEARITGGLVSPMVTGGVETVLGVTRDPVFGPLVMFGLGGVFVEVLHDVAFRLAPLTREAALAQIRSIKGLPLLQGAWGRPPVDLDALADALVALSDFALRHEEEVQSVEINPFIALPQGGLAVDAVMLRRTGRDG